ncbi:GNAT family N-acetyltransferase [Pseudohalioglobus lutimaris]|uniref:N-acetyltransferase n=1 Tax=Pseudohalioglobus lutimaris TaxID=1737061 RepID=A0A2N5WXY5_9GAMM|nr:GNAT family N-acetyltransferase [Pseudohalioglobus lutimaris]PLW67078.1 N-acetyltransferase [Pseudohalioglobus lutimaris]
MSIPLQLVHSAHLTLRPILKSDLTDLMQVNGDSEVTRFLPYPTWESEKDAQAWWVRMEERMSTGTAKQFVIHHPEDGKVIGSVLLFNYDEGSSRLEIGYVLARSYWRRGYAREALNALLRQLMGESGIRRVEAEVNPENTASNALLASLGFSLEGCRRERWLAESGPYSVNVYGLLASELPAFADTP